MGKWYVVGESLGFGCGALFLGAIFSIVLSRFLGGWRVSLYGHCLLFVVIILFIMNQRQSNPEGESIA